MKLRLPLGAIAGMVVLLLSATVVGAQPASAPEQNVAPDGAGHSGWV